MAAFPARAPMTGCCFLALLGAALASAGVAENLALRGAVAGVWEKTKLATNESVSLPSPRRVLYIDYRDVDWNNPAITIKAAVDAGYNVILLAFLLNSSPADMAQVWASATPSQRDDAISYAHSKGAVVMVSAGGSTVSPWSTYSSGSAYGSYAGSWAASHNLDGVDFDIENLAPGFRAGGMGGDEFLQWLADASIAAKQQVRFVSHAPQAPYFGPIGSSGASYWPGTSGGYSAVESKSSGAVDFYNVQFYNQGATCYTTYEGLFTTSSSDCSVFPGTAVAEIASYGVPLSKITVTKPLLPGDASNGYIAASALNGYLQQGSSGHSYRSGVSCWAYAKSSSASWISSVCSGGVC